MKKRHLLLVGTFGLSILAKLKPLIIILGIITVIVFILEAIPEKEDKEGGFKKWA